MKCEQEGSTADALAVLASKLNSLNDIASFVQQSFDSPGDNDAVVQVDFCENAAIIEQDEIRSAHWNHKHVAIYTAVAWTNLGTHSYCVVSNYLQNDKYATSLFNNTIITYL